jgi:hypothetical protein
VITLRTASTIAAVMIGAAAAAAITSRVVAPPRLTPSVAPSPIDPLPVMTPRWMVDLGPGADVPDRVNHRPIVVGDRVVISNSRLGYVAVAAATGAVAWRRPSVDDLAAPHRFAPHDVLLVHGCDQPVAAPAGRVIVACFERIDPIDTAASTAGAIHVVVADAATCDTGLGSWRVDGDAGHLTIARDACALAVALPSGTAVAIESPAPPSPLPEDCARLADGTPWCQRIVDGVSLVEVDGAVVPGLAALAAAHDDHRSRSVVRRDVTLRHDDLVVIVDQRPVAIWPLPPPSIDRATPIAVAVDATGVYVVFDGTWMAAFAPL